ncbi:MAG: YceI family protein [Nitriliruptoraceae bacterium]
MSTLQSLPTSQLTGTYSIDPAHSHVGFSARHAMVTRVRGSFTDVSGAIHVDGDNPAASSVEVTIDAASIDTRSDDRDAHLRSDDFFAVETYPTIDFASASIEPSGTDTYLVTGDLTIRDTSRPVSFELAFSGAATDPFGNERIGFEGSVEVNRKDWNLTWNAALETGGVLVSEKVTLEFEISAVRSH